MPRPRREVVDVPTGVLPALPSLVGPRRGSGPPALTFTGIEAVSNGIGIMREPRVRTAKRTMLLMATSLAITASGILLAYLLLHVVPQPGKTMMFFRNFSAPDSLRYWSLISPST